jgi:Tol biopolymer transport system component
MACLRLYIGLLATTAIGVGCSASSTNPPEAGRSLRQQEFGLDQIVAQCMTLGPEVDTETSLCTVDLEGEIVEMNLRLPISNRPSMSSDRSRVAIIERTGVLGVRLADGAVEHVIDVASTAVAVDWIPHRNAIAVLRVEGAVAAIDVVDLDAEAPTAVEAFRSSLGEGIDDKSISVHPNGESVLIAVVGAASSVFRSVDLSTNSSRIIQRIDGIGYSPAWSPNGDRIAFTHQMPRDQPSSISILDIESGDIDIVALAEAGKTTPTWSSDGNVLAYVDSRGALVTVDIASGSKRVVIDLTATQTGRLPALPTWS